MRHLKCELHNMTFKIQAVTHLAIFNVNSTFVIKNSSCYLFSQARHRETVKKNRVNPSSKSNTRPPETGENTYSSLRTLKVPLSILVSFRHDPKV